MTPPKDQAPGLIERLRDTSVWHQEKVTHTLRRYRVDRLDAATHIKQLEAENAELRGKLEKADALLGRLIKWDKDFPVNCWNGYKGLKELDKLISEATTALTDQANIRSPVQNLVRDQYNPEDEG